MYRLDRDRLVIREFWIGRAIKDNLEQEVHEQYQ